MNLSINKLIAQDIINYGMDTTSNFDYCVDLDSYLESFDEESQKYIKENVNEIAKDISSNESVADFQLIDGENGLEFDMVFYWGKLLDQIETIVLDNADSLKIELDLEDVRNIASKVINDDTFNDSLIQKIKDFKTKDKEL